MKVKIDPKKLAIAAIQADMRHHELATMLGIHYSNFYRRLKGESSWKKGELDQIVKRLDVDIEEIEALNPHAVEEK